MDALYYVAGIGFLALAKLKHVLRGYDSPKPYALDQVDRCIDYDIALAERFEANVGRYGATSLRGKRVLELGPGSDLGVGLLLIAKGASSYTGFDRNNLASNVPPGFYQRLAARVPEVDLASLTDGRISYVTREDFDVSAGITAGVDVVLSNAAFEHFDDVRSTVRQLTQVANPSTKLVVEIDMQTHSRWIREVDPNNIYRYPKWLYDLFRFPGQPNRWRPDDYVMEFERNGWGDIRLWPENQLDDRKHSRRVHPAFQREKLEWLSFVLCASRVDDAR